MSATSFASGGRARTRASCHGGTTTTAFARARARRESTTCNARSGGLGWRRKWKSPSLGRSKSGGQGSRESSRDAARLETGGGGKLPPPRVLKVSFSGDDSDGSGKDSQSFIPLGYATFLAFVLLVSKCLVCWCTNDVETAFMSIDLGFLSFLGWLCLFAFRAPSMAVLHPFLIELGSAIILEEMIFSMFAVNRIKPELNYKVTKDFLVHHIASVIMGYLALYFCTRAPGTGFVGVGVVGTEVTTFLPVAFRESVRSKKVSTNKKISVVLGTLFPLAFCWRSYWSSKMWLRLVEVGRRYIAMSPTLANQVLWRAGEVSVGTVVLCNFAWTYRIARGSMKVAMSKIRGKKIDQQHLQKEIE